MLDLFENTRGGDMNDAIGNIGGADGAQAFQQEVADLEKRLQEEFFKAMMESEIMDDIMQDVEE